MRRTGFCAAILLLLTLAGCAAGNSVPPSVAGSQGAPAAVSPAESVMPEYISVDRHRGNFYLGIEVAEEQQSIVMNAVEEYMLKSAAWEAVDTTALDARIHIYIRYTDGEIAEFDVFDKDGEHCMQWAQAGRYSLLSEEVYRPLYELAMGWYLPGTMVIQSSGESVYALRNWIWSQDEGVAADGMRLTPQEVSQDIEYITLADDFAPYIDGEVIPGVAFKLYDENFEEREYFIPSGMAAWTYIGHAGPGRYVAAAEYCFNETDGSSSGYQYFFGLVVPERNE